MEQFNSGREDKAIVMTPDLKLREVYRVIDGRYPTTTQICNDTDIVIFRKKRTNAVRVDMNGNVFDKQKVLDSIPKEVYDWFIKDDGGKLPTGEWWDGNPNNTASARFARERIIYEFIGGNSPELLETILDERNYLGKNAVPKKKLNKPIPENGEFSGVEDAKLTLIIWLTNSNVVSVELNDVSDTINVNAIAEDNNTEIHKVLTIKDDGKNVFISRFDATTNN